MMDWSVLFPDLLETHGIPAPTSHLEDRDLPRRDYWAALRPLGAILSTVRAETICRPQPGRDRRRTPTPASRRTSEAIAVGGLKNILADAMFTTAYVRQVAAFPFQRPRSPPDTALD